MILNAAVANEEFKSAEQGELVQELVERLLTTDYSSWESWLYARETFINPAEVDEDWLTLTKRPSPSIPKRVTQRSVGSVWILRKGCTLPTTRRLSLRWIFSPMAVLRTTSRVPLLCHWAISGRLFSSSSPPASVLRESTGSGSTGCKEPTSTTGGACSVRLVR